MVVFLCIYNYYLLTYLLLVVLIYLLADLEVRGDVTSCLIHSFSPHVEREAARRFLDPARDNHYYANSPAITWDDHQLVLVSRVWLDRER